VTMAAKTMCQPVPRKMPANVKEAEALLTKMEDAKAKVFLELSKDIISRYPDVAAIHPFILAARIMAACQAGEYETAEKDAAQLKEFPEYGGTAEAFGRVALLLDSRARQFEKEQKQLEAELEKDPKNESLTEKLGKAKASADDSFGKANKFFSEMLSIDPTLETINAKQRFDMFCYIIQLQHDRGVAISVDDKIQLAKTFLEQTSEEEQAAKADRIDSIRLMLAEYYGVSGKLEDAAAIYQDLLDRYGKDFEERRKKDPRAPRTALHWQAVEGMALAQKGLGRYEDALANFATIRQSVKSGSDRWWKAVYQMGSCWEQMKEYGKVFELIRDQYRWRPTMGGADMKNNFLMILTSMLSKPDDQIPGVDRAQLTDLTDKIQKEMQ